MGVKKESYLLLLSDRKAVFGGVFQAFVLDGRRIEPSTLYTVNFGSWFFSISIRWAFFLAWGLSSTSLFLIFDVNDKRDDVLEAVKQRRRRQKNPSTIGTTRLKQWKMTEMIPTPTKLHLLMNLMFFWDFIIDFLFCLSVAIIFFGVDMFVFAVVYSMRDYWKWRCLVFEEKGCLFICSK